MSGHLIAPPALRCVKQQALRSSHMQALQCCPSKARLSVLPWRPQRKPQRLSCRLSDGEMAILEKLDSLKDEMNQGMASLQSSLAHVQQDVAHLQQDVAHLQQDVARLQSNQGYLIEKQLRDTVAQMFGVDYARPLNARSVLDLMLTLPLTGDDIQLRRTALAEQAISRLLDDNIPQQLLHSMHSQLCKAYPGITPWFDGSGQLRMDNLGMFIRACENASLKEALVRLSRVLRMSSRDDQLKELMKCESAGVMCVIAAALPQMYLSIGPDSTSNKNTSSSNGGSSNGGSSSGASSRTDSSGSSVSNSGADASSNIVAGNSNMPAALPAPSRELEFDCRGRLDARDAADYAYIDIGEVKTSADYRSAVPQLGVRLGVLRWLITTCLKVPSDNITCVGRMFVLGSRHVADLDQQQQTSAANEWCYSLYLHVV